MSRLLFIAILLCFAMQSCMVKTKPNMDFVHKKDLEAGAEVVSIRVPMFLTKTFLMGKIKELKQEDPIAGLAFKKIKGLKIMTISGSAQTNLQPKFQRFLVKNKFEEMMSLYSDGAQISINTLMKGDVVKRVFLGIVDDEDYVFVDIKSKLNLNELSALIAYYEQNNNKKTIEIDSL